MFILSILTGLFALALLFDALALSGALYAALPAFSAPLAAFVGFFIAFLWHFDLKEKGKTKYKKTRGFAMALMGCNLVLCICTCALWLYHIIQIQKGI